MAGRTILKVENPTTQNIDSVKSLLAYVGRASDPLPTDVSLEGGRLVLILSNKKDAYYCTTARACSCPANTWHPGTPCKHQRKHFPQAKVATKATANEPLIKRGGFKPFDEMPGEEKAKAPSLSAIDCHDTTDLDAAYWSIKEDREMWAALGEA
jgi:hypothetical protein